MSDDPAGFEELSIEEEALEACRLIQSETIRPLSWIFPATNTCASCVLITGGRPEVMAYYCPRVIERLSDRAGSEDPEEQA